jgi:hypothetical protein
MRGLNPRIHHFRETLSEKDGWLGQAGDRIVGIEAVADPERLRQFDLTVLYV